MEKGSTVKFEEEGGGWSFEVLKRYLAWVCGKPLKEGGRVFTHIIESLWEMCKDEIFV